MSSERKERNNEWKPDIKLMAKRDLRPFEPKLVTEKAMNISKQKSKLLHRLLKH